MFRFFLLRFFNIYLYFLVFQILYFSIVLTPSGIVYAESVKNELFIENFLLPIHSNEKQFVQLYFENQNRLFCPVSGDKSEFNLLKKKTHLIILI